jgi:hypothetical protein
LPVAAGLGAIGDSHPQHRRGLSGRCCQDHPDHRSLQLRDRQQPVATDGSILAELENSAISDDAPLISPRPSLINNG